jgi:peptidoglycan/LPS O-acetylase OafA/YrhL
MAAVSTTPARSGPVAPVVRGHCVRYRSFDALRGIAAGIVVIHHCLMTLPQFSDVVLHGIHRTTMAEILGYPPLSLLWAGDAAVKVFFALSGFVLALMFLRPDPPSYAAFCAKRICRIYIPYIIVVAGALLLMTATSPHQTPELSEWFNASWNHSITRSLMWDHALMLGQLKYNFVDNPIWSLVHEMRYSLVFPMIMWLVTRVGSQRLVAASLVLSVAAMSALGRTGNYWAIDSLQYAFLFVTGAVLAQHQTRIATWFRSLARPFRIALGLTSLLLLGAHGIAHAGSYAVRVFAAVAPHLGAVLLLICVIGSTKAGTVLEKRPCLWAGRVSYSLYLSHLVVLLTLISILHRLAPIWLILLLVFPLALAVAEALFRSLERPAMALGHLLESWIDGFAGRVTAVPVSGASMNTAP